MSEQKVQCAKLGRELPAIDETTPEGRSALKMAQLLGGVEMRERVQREISADAWRLWKDRMLMVINEYRLDPSSDEANRVLGEHMEAFLFGDSKDIPGYVPPSS